MFSKQHEFASAPLTLFRRDAPEGLKFWATRRTLDDMFNPTNVPSLKDATLVVRLSSAICRYLMGERE